MYIIERVIIDHVCSLRFPANSFTEVFFAWSLGNFRSKVKQRRRIRVLIIHSWTRDGSDMRRLTEVSFPLSVSHGFYHCPAPLGGYQQVLSLFILVGEVNVSTVSQPSYLMNILTLKFRETNWGDIIFLDHSKSQEHTFIRSEDL